MDFTFLRSRKVYAALEGHPDRPSLKTVERWCAGTSPAPQWAVDAMRPRVLGRHKEAPPPGWVTELKQDLLDAIRGAGLTEQERAALRALDATSKPTEVADGVQGEEV